MQCSESVMLLLRGKVDTALMMAVQNHTCVSYARQMNTTCLKPASPRYPSSALDAMLSSDAGLSSQLAAQAVLPALEDLHAVHMEQLVRTLSSRQTGT